MLTAGAVSAMAASPARRARILSFGDFLPDIDDSWMYSNV